MIQSVRSSHSKYRVYLENQKKQKKEKIEGHPIKFAKFWNFDIRGPEKGFAGIV